MVIFNSYVKLPEGISFLVFINPPCSSIFPGETHHVMVSPHLPIVRRGNMWTPPRSCCGRSWDWWTWRIWRTSEQLIDGIYIPWFIDGLSMLMDGIYWLYILETGIMENFQETNGNTGWWWLEHEWIMTFHKFGTMIPTDKLIFFRGLETTNQYRWFIRVDAWLRNPAPVDRWFMNGKHPMILLDLAGPFRSSKDRDVILMRRYRL